MLCQELCIFSLNLKPIILNVSAVCQLCFALRFKSGKVKPKLPNILFSTVGEIHVCGKRSKVP